MRHFIRFVLKSIPLTIGVILTLLALSFLVQFVENGAYLSDLEDEDFWAFIFFAMVGVPTLLFGVNELAE